MARIRRRKKKPEISVEIKSNQPQLVQKNALAPTFLNDNVLVELTIPKNVSSNTSSVKSFKSMKAKRSANRIIPKKEKLKWKKEMLLKKINVVKKMKKELKVRKKRQKVPIIGDTNPLHDALPSLEPLLKNRSSVRSNVPQVKKKGIEKARKRKKKLIRDVDTFKMAIKNKSFKSNPFEAISNHIQAVVDQERNSARK